MRILRLQWDRDRFTEGFLGHAAEQPLGALVPTLDGAIEALAYNRIITELEAALGRNFGRLCDLRYADECGGLKAEIASGLGVN